jgi:hypothetical protein
MSWCLAEEIPEEKRGVESVGSLRIIREILMGPYLAPLAIPLRGESEHVSPPRTLPIKTIISELDRWCTDPMDNRQKLCFSYNKMAIVLPSRFSYFARAYADDTEM